MFKLRFKFSTQSLFILLTVTAFTVWGGEKLWTKPYAIVGRYPDGTLAWEQWERRTFSMRNEIYKTCRWFPDGKLAVEWSAEKKQTKLFGRNDDVYNGSDRTEAAEWFRKYGDEIAGSTQTNERPLESFLRWWNGIPLKQSKF